MVALAATAPSPPRSFEERRILLDEAEPMIFNLARCIRRRYPAVRKCVSADQLVSAGYVAAERASRAFDSERGAPFKAFAYPGVWGAMWDEVSSLMPHYAGRIKAKRKRQAVPGLPDLCSSRKRQPHSEAVLDRLRTPPRYAPDEEAASAEVVRAVRACLAALPQPLASILEQRAAGVAMLRVAKSLGISRARLYVLLPMAEARLRALLRAHGITPDSI